jgi:lipoprotein-anchoring transpeptidase ErfK/SrfK
MTFFKDGELVVSTPVVTGRSWGHMTPSGLYKIQNKSPDRWLSGEDYTVFVHYWMAFNGAYGIHDAKWRTIFGGTQYINNGSHGCVNTPTEAMAAIYEVAEVGMPVLVFNIPAESAE